MGREQDTEAIITNLGGVGCKFCDKAAEYVEKWLWVRGVF